jgi:hypothetical protein
MSTFATEPASALVEHEAVPPSSSLLTRRCPCGGTAGIDGECPACRARRLSRSQTKAKGEGEREIAPPTDEVPAPELLDLEEGPEALEEEEEEPAAAEEPTAEEAPPAAAEAPPVPAVPSVAEVPKEKIYFRVIEAPPPDGKGKTKCPVPRNVPVAFTPPKRSTAAQIAAMSASTWGITSPDPLKVATLTCRDGANWRLRVTAVVSDIRTFSRQLPGQVAPTTRNSTAANFCGQVTDLDRLGRAGPGHFYLLAAVRAHEAVHVQEWKTSMGSNWPAQKAIIEGLSVPASGATKTKAKARAAMRGSAAFRAAQQTDSASGNYPAFWGIPDPNAQTDAAERVIVTPQIRALCVNARNRGFGPAACPVCANLGIV